MSHVEWNWEHQKVRVTNKSVETDNLYDIFSVLNVPSPGHSILTLGYKTLIPPNSMCGIPIFCKLQDKEDTQRDRESQKEVVFNQWHIFEEWKACEIPMNSEALNTEDIEKVGACGEWAQIETFGT